MSASPTTIVPVTIQAERKFEHPAGSVFDAYADVNQRMRWIVPAGDAITFESHDFGAGGSDHLTRGARDNPILSTVRYEHIIHNDCIVFTERLESSSNEFLAISLVSWSIASSGSETLLTITDQTTSAVGSRPIEGARLRYEAMFDRLANHLTDRAGG